LHLHLCLISKFQTFFHTNGAHYDLTIVFFVVSEGAKFSDNRWYFFSFSDRKYATGSRANRATKSGYWKGTGKGCAIYHHKTRGIIGMRKTLVFYSGRAPNGMKTGWVMHEFRLENPHTPPKVLLLLLWLWFLIYCRTNYLYKNIVVVIVIMESKVASATASPQIYLRKFLSNKNVGGIMLYACNLLVKSYMLNLF